MENRTILKRSKELFEEFLSIKDYRELASKYSEFCAEFYRAYNIIINKKKVFIVQEMIDILKRVYKEENLDVYQLEDLVKGNISIEKNISFCIRFPEFTITNSRGFKHLIREAYAKFTLDITVGTASNKFRIDLPAPKLYREYITPDESFAGYYHSHISGQGRQMCVGGGDLMRLMNRLGDEYTPEMFELYLETFNEAIKWESLEGNPYNYIEDVGKTGSTSVMELNENGLAVRENMDNVLNIIHKYVKEEEISLPFTYNEKLVIIPDNGEVRDFEKLIASRIEKNEPENTKKNCLYFLKGGKYYPAFQIERSLPPLSNIQFIFKRETKQLKYYNDKIDDTNKEYRIPKVYLRKYLETFKDYFKFRHYLQTAS